MNKNGKTAILQIMILLVSIVAFSYLVGAAGTPYPSSETSLLSKIFGQKGATFGNAALSGLQYGVLTYLAVKQFAPFFGVDDEGQVEAYAKAAAFGATAYKFASIYSSGAKWAGWVGLGVAALVYVYTAEETSYKVVKFSCLPYQAPVGGDNCDLCNQQGLPCSKYQCNSLGQSCELLNEGTDEEACVWVNRQDSVFPTIEANEEDLLDGYTYTPSGTVNPPDRGVVIEYDGSSDHCIPAFTPFKFGVFTNELAQCKVDYLNKPTFDEMDFYFNNNNAFRTNHTQTLILPGNTSSEGLTLENDGNFDLFVRCQDANGNVNSANFVFQYCMDQEADLKTPYVVNTDVNNGLPVAYNQDSLDLSVYINEPAECKWSTEDKAFDNMENSMSCSSSILDQNAVLTYPCTTTLTGIGNEKENVFYFRCKDQPQLASTRDGDRNVNSESYRYSVFGTKPLIVTDVGPNGTVRDSTEAVKVTLTAFTAAGYKDGESVCSYREPGAQGYIEFFNTNSFKHSTDLFLADGEYDYEIRCVDLGGNSDNKTVSFEVESDSSAPNVARAFKDGPNLKIITDEKSECVFDTSNCNYQFEDGLPMTKSDDGLSHYVEWSSKSKLYIKCSDEFENKPSPDECSIIVRPL